MSAPAVSPPDGRTAPARAIITNAGVSQPELSDATIEHAEACGWGTNLAARAGEKWLMSRDGGASFAPIPAPLTIPRHHRCSSAHETACGSVPISTRGRAPSSSSSAIRSGSASFEWVGPSARLRTTEGRALCLRERSEHAAFDLGRK